MQRVALPFARRRSEPVIGLVNIVFLMLVFFLIAGSVAPIDRELRLVRLDTAGAPPPPDVLTLTADGTLRAGGTATTVAEFLDGRERDVVRLMPDRETSAARLVEVTRELRAAGAARVLLITERAAP